jgi:hypothetical protein
MLEKRIEITEHHGKFKAQLKLAEGLRNEEQAELDNLDDEMRILQAKIGRAKEAKEERR